jgi:4-amino-4-deoxy-L-arabinose transferase-like glycosyltransferase
MVRFTEVLKYLVLATIITIPIFGHLEALPIRIWDESRLAVNAFEMLYNGNFLVTHYEGFPDMWNTKPPLLVWFQVFFMKIFGPGELAVRLPSAIAAFITCISILLFSNRYIKNFWYGFIAIFILVSCQGYISIHGTRTGDYDSLLTLFTTLSGFMYFSYCETRQNKYLHLFFTFTILAILTKGIAGLMFAPALISYSLIRGNLVYTLKNKHFYIGLSYFLTVVFGFYTLREAYNPGYLDAVMKNELGGRYLSALEGHANPFSFYYENLIQHRMTNWYLLVPCGILFGLASIDERIKRLTIFAALNALSFFLIISSAETKLEWYDISMYPYLAILAANVLYIIFLGLKEYPYFQKNFRINFAPFIFLLLVGLKPYSQSINNTYKPKEFSWEKDFYDIGYYLREGLSKKHDLNNQYLLYEGYCAHNLFYIKILNAKGINTSIISNWKDLEIGDVVITCQPNMTRSIEDNFSYSLIYEKNNVKTVKIDGKLD